MMTREEVIDEAVRRVLMEDELLDAFIRKNVNLESNNSGDIRIIAVLCKHKVRRIYREICMRENPIPNW